jgi:hypothetical protein
LVVPTKVYGSFDPCFQLGDTFVAGLLYDSSRKERVAVGPERVFTVLVEGVDLSFKELNIPLSFGFFFCASVLLCIARSQTSCPWSHLEVKMWIIWCVNFGFAVK